MKQKDERREKREERREKTIRKQYEINNTQRYHRTILWLCTYLPCNSLAMSMLQQLTCRMHPSHFTSVNVLGSGEDSGVEQALMISCCVTGACFTNSQFTPFVPGEMSFLKTEMRPEQEDVVTIPSKELINSTRGRMGTSMDPFGLMSIPPSISARI